MEKLLAAAIVAFVPCACGDITTELKDTPKMVSKQIIAKERELYTEEKLDEWAFFTDGKLRSVPIVKTRYKLYARDGTYLEVDARKYALVDRLDHVEALETEWK